MKGQHFYLVGALGPLKLATKNGPGDHSEETTKNGCFFQLASDF